METRAIDPSSQVPATDAPALAVRLASPREDRARDAWLRTRADASFFHLSTWGKVVRKVHGHARHDLVAVRGERIVGLLPLMICRSLRGRRNLVSMPYAVYGGPIGEDAEVVERLLRAARSEGERLGTGRVELRCLDDPGGDLPRSDLYWTFLKELPDTPEGVLQDMPKKARAEARKARDRHGLELAQGEWYVDDLARLYLENKHALGSPALPPRHFHAILEAFDHDQVFVHLVRKDRQPLAAVMSFAFGDTLIAYYSGTRTGADRALSASNFMYMALQQWAVERGFRTFDFCRSRADSGAFQFKKHQGFEPRQLHYRYILVRDRATPSFTPSNPKTRLLRLGWSKLPPWAAQRLSSRLSRYLP